MLRLSYENHDSRSTRPGCLSSQKVARWVASGKLHRLAKGVYCDPADVADLPTFMRRNATRIVNYLLPECFLMSVSAEVKGAMVAYQDANGAELGAPVNRIYVAGSYARTIELPFLEIVQAHISRPGATRMFCRRMEDGREAEYGSLDVMCAADELVLLHNFGRRRYHPERYVGDEAMLELRERLENQFGEHLDARLEMLASEAGELDENLKRAREWLAIPIGQLRPKSSPVAQPLRQFTVGWYGRQIGEILHTGTNWRFRYDPSWKLPLSCAQAVNTIPAFVSNGFPEGFGRDALINQFPKGDLGATILAHSERYLANVAIVDAPARLAALPHDVLAGRLSEYAPRDAIFAGSVHGLPPVDARHMMQLAKLVSQREMPRISGFQAKVPMHLDAEGRLTLALGNAFTHILKLPYCPGDDIAAGSVRGAVEWAAMSMVQASGTEVAPFALVELRCKALGLLSERFDIPQSDDDMRLVFAEDFCALLGLDPSEKYFTAIEGVVRGLRAHTTNWEVDRLALMRQLIASLLVENSDLHLKNLAVVKVAEPTLTGFRSVRLAPAFDVISTPPYNMAEPFPPHPEPMVFHIGRPPTRYYSREDLHYIGGLLGIDRGQVDSMLEAQARAIDACARRIVAEPPSLLVERPEVLSTVRRVCQRVSRNCQAFVPDLASEATQTFSEPARQAPVRIPTTQAPQAPLAPALPLGARGAARAQAARNALAQATAPAASPAASVPEGAPDSQPEPATSGGVRLRAPRRKP